ncbi:glycosyltransferase family 4 protein [Chlorobium phaeovibrioides]|uniref:Glycosyltransferase family 4 protein n=1 Tax=Chlorobium phaeovibrioides TaxID=1094 RepID=A0A5M8IA87_CHLPH|nr:glycosyltransferase family 4 protein [Chlorobium phaeovibrioides]KAA6232291.1 glycosyltransferase family 4 protein [Chlorobium phaeovibrioides]
MHLTLFFTHKASLKTWDGVGMFEREVALYRKYLEKGMKISFITYGRKDKELFSERLSGIEILCNSTNLPTALYTKLIPLLHAKTLRKTNIIKSNQTPGAITALRTASLHNKPMLARCGYMHSINTAYEQGKESIAALMALRDEKQLFTKASHIEVTTNLMKENILSRITMNDDKITVIPNYVDINLFAPNQSEKIIDLIFIGRLRPEKNLFALLNALQGLSLKIVFIGTGAQERELKAHASELGIQVDWKGNIPNVELSRYLQQAKLFILPSHYEGHPKTLIEAMATGVPVIGADSPGIREVVKHLENGWLCGTNHESIKEAIMELSASQPLRTHLGKKARAFAVAHYALDHIVEKELMLIEKIISTSRFTRS